MVERKRVGAAMNEQLLNLSGVGTKAVINNSCTNTLHCEKDPPWKKSVWRNRGSGVEIQRNLHTNTDTVVVLELLSTTL